VNLTIHNGIIVNVDREKIQSISPHIDKGSVVVVQRGDLSQAIHVMETVEEVLKLKDE